MWNVRAITVFPSYWLNFLHTHGLTGRFVCVDEQHDASGLGIDMGFLTEEQSVDEATNCWPGIVVSKDGYVPIGSCLTGSGDYYYVNTADGPSGAVYRVYHDAVHESGYEASEAVQLVLKSYDDLLSHLDP